MTLEVEYALWSLLEPRDVCLDILAHQKEVMMTTIIIIIIIINDVLNRVSENCLPNSTN